LDDSRLDEILAAARLTLPPGADVRIDGADPVLASRYPAGEAAAVALAAQATAAAELWRVRTGRPQAVAVDVRAAAASLVSFLLMRLDGGPPPQREAAALPTVALYECADRRWIHLHGAFPKLLAGTLDVLQCGPARDEIAAAVKTWRAQDLEDALAQAGMCGGMARTIEEWMAHPQGQALADLAVVEIERIGDAPPEPLPAGDRPLAGIRALDLTRVLAGPACGRTLAEHGADVMLVNSPNLPNVAAFVLDTSHGKRSAYLDLDEPAQAATLRDLIRGADVFTQGYRSGAMERRGLAPKDVAAMRPGIVYVSINCYGHTGPWHERPGWEQLAQTATGIAVTHGTPQQPQLIPAAACDYTTGYLAAYGVMTALARRAIEGGSWHVRASLAQTAMWLTRLGTTRDPPAATGLGDLSQYMMDSQTAGGVLTHLAPSARMSETPPRWDRPSPALGADPPAWSL
jgi:crotonobetainyl-CoA:carnitine CoA-transferase CaiB-like acyl-CoA transferase